LRQPDRQQVIPAMALEDLLETDHQARVVWDFCTGLDLEPLYESIRSLANAVWELAASYDDERRHERVRTIALGAAATASGLAEDARDLRLAELVVQVRSVAVDLLRAAEQASGAQAAPERPTDELLT